MFKLQLRIKTGTTDEQSTWSLLPKGGGRRGMGSQPTQGEQRIKRERALWLARTFKGKVAYAYWAPVRERALTVAMHGG